MFNYRINIVGAVIALAGVGGLAAAPAGAQPAAAVPTQLQPPAPATQLLRANAQGVQIYACTAKPGGGPEWALKGPDATLTDDSGKTVAKHFAGPTWQANDGSKVVGEAVANVPAPGGGAVAWLLLKAKSHEGAGEFAAVTFIQRLDTKGGVAPATGCDAGHIGQEVRVPYSAVYVLFK